MNHLILVAIGPVQPFIAAARKLRDLAAGSWLLSELSKTIARAIAESGGTLIFPDPDIDLAAGSDASVANKILAEIPASIAPTEFCRVLRAAWVKARRGLYERAWIDLAHACGSPDLGIEKARFDGQADAQGEFYAVWTEIPEGGYAEARREVERRLAARKTLREFAAPRWQGAGIAKNSLDGVFESVLPSGERARRVLRDRFGVKREERLDALGLVKRCTRREHTFDSLHDLAVQPWLAGLAKETAGAAALQSYRDLFGGEFENSLWFEWGLADWEAEKESLPSGAREGLARIHRNWGAPESYAAILVGDGDHMGAAIDAIAIRAGHQDFSAALAGFAAGAAHILKRHSGQLIYSGGDDVLAFLPLHTMLAAAEDLRSAFVCAVSTPCGGLAKPPTFSAGIAIVHAKAPLSWGLAVARRAESEAKNVHGRDALSIIVNTRGNAETEIGGHWDGDWLGTLRSAISGFVARSLPSRFGYQLRHAAAPFGKDRALAFDAHGKPADAFTAEMLRIAQRKDSGEQGAESYLSPGARPLTIARLLAVARRLGRAQQFAAS